MIQPQTILRQRNEIQHHPDVESITAPLQPQTITQPRSDPSCIMTWLGTSRRYTSHELLRANSIHQHPKLRAPPPAPQTACPLAPGRQARKTASTGTPNCTPPSTRRSSSQNSIHQHPKPHPPAPQTACPLAPGRQARKAASTSTPNCMPLSTRPSSSQSSIQQHPQTACPLTPGRQAWKAASTSTPNCMPPSTRPSISQIAFHSLLEVRTPVAFSYLGNNALTYFFLHG